MCVSLSVSLQTDLTPSHLVRTAVFPTLTKHTVTLPVSRNAHAVRSFASPAEVLLSPKSANIKKKKNAVVPHKIFAPLFWLDFSDAFEVPAPFHIPLPP